MVGPQPSPRSLPVGAFHWGSASPFLILAHSFAFGLLTPASSCLCHLSLQPVQNVTPGLSTQVWATRSLSYSVHGKSVFPAARVKPSTPSILLHPVFRLSDKHVDTSFQKYFFKTPLLAPYPQPHLHARHLGLSPRHHPCALRLLRPPPDCSASLPPVVSTQ